mmetsp:Transcript_3727/g.5511  ORF Transcript_3727/g.5511 Transcript_3727/m.5511 type:complete len:496 (+) Transcript_3727:42-1529(+)
MNNVWWIAKGVKNFAVEVAAPTMESDEDYTTDEENGELKENQDTTTPPQENENIEEETIDLEVNENEHDPVVLLKENFSKPITDAEVEKVDEGNMDQSSLLTFKRTCKLIQVALTSSNPDEIETHLEEEDDAKDNFDLPTLTIVQALISQFQQMKGINTRMKRMIKEKQLEIHQKNEALSKMEKELTKQRHEETTEENQVDFELKYKELLESYENLNMEKDAMNEQHSKVKKDSDDHKQSLDVVEARLKSQEAKIIDLEKQNRELEDAMESTNQIVESCIEERDEAKQEVQAIQLKLDSLKKESEKYLKEIEAFQNHQYMDQKMMDDNNQISEELSNVKITNSLLKSMLDRILHLNASNTLVDKRLVYESLISFLSQHHKQQLHSSSQQDESWHLLVNHVLTLDNEQQQELKKALNIYLQDNHQQSIYTLNHIYDAHGNQVPNNIQGRSLSELWIEFLLKVSNSVSNRISTTPSSSPSSKTKKGNGILPGAEFSA